jgi:hypothetical protein
MLWLGLQNFNWSIWPKILDKIRNMFGPKMKPDPHKTTIVNNITRFRNIPVRKAPTLKPYPHNFVNKGPQVLANDRSRQTWHHHQRKGMFFLLFLNKLHSTCIFVSFIQSFKNISIYHC